jgi:hypothetical protein
MGRMIGAMPFAYSAVAYAISVGAREIASGVRSVTWSWRAGSGLVAVTMIVIFVINAYNYFVVYPRTLPNGNTPFDLAIARQVDTTGAAAESVVVGCCWGEWGQPEPSAIQDRVSASARLLLATDTQDALSKLQTYVPRGSAVVLYLDPALKNGGAAFHSAVQVQRQSMFRVDGWDVAWVVVGRRR